MTLPSRPRLAPHRTVLPRGPRRRQVGLDPDTALVVDDLPPALAQLLDELAVADDATGPLARAVARGADPDGARALLAELAAAGAVVDARDVERPADRRRHSTVLVEGSGLLAAGVVTGLVQGGAGVVHVRATGTVGSADLGTGLVDADLGRDRVNALVDAARRLHPGAAVGPPPERSLPDLVVLADAQVPDPALVARLHVEGLAHLPVRLRDGTGVVGPLVLPGRSACLGCLELHRRARDPGWPAVTAQLLGREGSGEPEAAAATAALAVAQVLAVLDGGSGHGPADGGDRAAAGAAPPVLGATLELDLTGGTLLRRPWPAHPDCTCGAPRSETSGLPDGRVTIMG